MIKEFFMNIFWEGLEKLGWALLIGGLVGAEREYRSKSAGFRTMMLISMGACLFTLMSEHIGLGGTPDRIASNVVVGIGFVGAGVIFKSDNRVIGLTTATSIWMTAAMGMAVAAGFTALALAACVMVLIVMSLLPKLQKLIDHLNQERLYKIVTMHQHKALDEFEELFKQNKLSFIRGQQLKQGDLLTGYWYVQGSEKRHKKFIKLVMNDKDVQEFQF